jgi:predicted nucleic acid-binding protein
MNGNRYLLDTNAIIALLQGNETLLQQLKNAQWVGISVISQLEFLVFPNLTDSDKVYFNKFLQRVDVIGLTTEQLPLITKIINLRRQYRLKLPDAIIVGAALQRRATLVSADKRLHKIDGIPVLDFQAR